MADPNIRVQWRWAIPPFRAYWTRTAYDGHTYEAGVCRWTPWAARDRAERLSSQIGETT